MAVATTKRTARVANSSAVAADLIRQAILDGELPAGSRLKEDELAARLDVSRTPVREALRRLEAEGLVVHEAKRGAAVRAYSASELDDMYRLRAMLEGYAARRAAERMTPELAEQLRARDITVNGLAPGLEPPGAGHTVTELVALLDRWRGRTTLRRSQ